MESLYTDKNAGFPFSVCKSFDLMNNIIKEK